MEYSIIMKETNWIHDLKYHKILLLIWVFSTHSLQFQMLNKGVLTSLQLLDYKLIAISIFEELRSVKSYNVRGLTNPPNTYFSDGFCFVGAQWEFESRFPFFYEVFYSEDDSTNSNSYDIIYFTKLFPLQHDAQSAPEQIHS